MEIYHGWKANEKKRFLGNLWEYWKRLNSSKNDTKWNVKKKKQLFSSSIPLDIGSNSQFFEINLQETTFIFMQKINGYFGNFRNARPSPSKIIVLICKKLSCLSLCKKSTSIITSFLRYCNDMQTYYFGYFGHPSKW